MIIDAILPAHNEAPTIAAVVKTVVASSVFRRVLVVDDGSGDATSRIGTLAGADVVRLVPNGGKAEAMYEGITASDRLAEHYQLPRADAFAFFDADLLGLTTAHVQLLAAHFVQNSDGHHVYDMVCGLRDYGWTNVFQLVTPLMTGERFVKRWVLEGVPPECRKGFMIEMALNHVVDRGGKTCAVPLDGLTIRMKQAKVGFVKGWIGHFKMAKQMSEARTLLERLVKT